ncbi:patatin-like phospholipase family protein [Olsenella urininfantis]|uniref:patatin-like phospholipase family protein n=1 Tax=Olsenella urininfantis TaxID=1871033 RepID=UPI0009876BE3|nr:patatin family protein [Olsenella urininfantis]
MAQGNALVLEGGGFRGMFTSGVLDVLQEHGLYDFESVWGVSAGALNAACFKSRQIGRAMRIMLAYRDDRRFMSFWSLATTGDLAGGEFMYEEIQNHLDPGDNLAFNESDLRMFVVASDVVFGTPAYLECKTFPEDVRKLRASASLPLVSQMVNIEGHRYLDGGTTDSIPFEMALGTSPTQLPGGYVPARRALVVITQDRAYEKDGFNERLSIRSHRYDGYPYYLDALKTRADRYNAQRARLFDLEGQADSPVLVIAPERPVEVATNEGHGGKLLDLYLQGRRQVEARLAEIDAFLAQGGEGSL